MPSFKILIVDDDPDDRQIMNEACSLHGYQHHLILSSAEEAFTYLQQVNNDGDLPKILIIDLKMPGISGYELLKALKGMERYKDIDVYVYSSVKDPSYNDKCIELGAKEFIAKPNKIKGYLDLVDRLYKMINIK